MSGFLLSAVLFLLLSCALALPTFLPMKKDDFLNMFDISIETQETAEMICMKASENNEYVVECLVNGKIGEFCNQKY